MAGNKILVALDESIFSENALDYALHFFDSSENLLTGLIVENLDYLMTEETIEDQTTYFSYAYDVFELTKDDVDATRKRLVNHFYEKCADKEIHFSVHNDQGSPAEELVRETIYADLLIIGSQTYLAATGKPDQKVLKDTLREAHCPVFVVPRDFIKVEEILLTYDRKASSVFAIKQFCQLFGNACENKNVIVLSVLDEDEYLDEEEERSLKEYLEHHCNNVTFSQESGKVEDIILKRIEHHPNSLVVMGAYGRSALSMFFSSSTADKIMETQKAPLFITHE